MSVMERSVTETTLPIYHRSIDWDALYRRYPVPDVFAKTRWKWSADEIRKFQNEQFLDLMKTGWRNGFYQRRWKAAGHRAGRHQKHRRYRQTADLRFRRHQKGSGGESAVRPDQRQRRRDTQDAAAQAANLGRHHRQAATDALCPARMGAQRADPSHAYCIFAACGPGDRRANSAHLLARQCRLVLLQGLPRLSRRAAAHHRHRRGHIVAAADRDRPGMGHQCLVRAPRIRHPTRKSRARRTQIRRARSENQIPRLRPRPRHREHFPQSARRAMGLQGLRHVRHARDGHGRLRVPASERPAFPRGLRPSSKSSASRTTSRSRTARSATWCARSCIAASSR